MDPLRTFFQHHAWANLRLIDHCARLPAETLELTVPGTRGTIMITLVHLVGADQRYLRRMDGQEAGIRIHESESPSLADVRAAAELQAARWEALVERAPELDVTMGAQGEFPEVLHAEDLLFLQAIHHGNEHRAHVCTILGATGLEAPDVSGWLYWLEERAPAPSTTEQGPG